MSDRDEKTLDICSGIWYSIKAVSERQAQNRKFGLERLDSSKKNLKKFLTNASGFDILNKLLMSS